MGEWWTYRPSDFLMFSPRIYWRLFESLNEAFWPVQPLLVIAGLVWLVLRPNARAASLLLGACWIGVAWSFHHQRFAPINWVADGFAVSFALQGLALFVLAAKWGTPISGDGWRGRVALALALWALLLHPLLVLLAQRRWQQAEVFGLAPDPTAIATLALLLLLRPDPPQRRWVRSLWVVPLAWCGVSAATLGTMGSGQAWAPLLAAAAAIAVARFARPHNAA